MGCCAKCFGSTDQGLSLIHIYEIRVQYDGDPSPTSIHLPGKLGNPQYVVLQNTNGRFAEGDLLAAKLSIPPSHKADVYGQPISYYTQIQPVLEQFEAFLKEKGYADANLRVGEDVGQLDMVACASPHWGPQWLGGTNQSANTIISNCVHKNAWAIKQLVQTRPAILILVGQASWNMFRDSFSHLVRAPHPIPTLPKDGPYTLLELTTKQDYRLVFSIEISGVKYELSTRLLITPHFSYNENFLPQFRMAPAVSYTHLDVYKRQIINSLVIRSTKPAVGNSTVWPDFSAPGLGVSA